MDCSPQIAEAAPHALTVTSISLDYVIMESYPMLPPTFLMLPDLKRQHPAICSMNVCLVTDMNRSK